MSTSTVSTRSVGIALMSTAADPASPDMAPPVDEHERAVGAEVAQVEQVEPGFAEIGVRPAGQVARPRTDQRRALHEEIGEAGLPRLFDRRRRIGCDRIGEIEFGPRDARSGDDDVVARIAGGLVPGLTGVGVLLLRDRGMVQLVLARRAEMKSKGFMAATPLSRRSTLDPRFNPNEGAGCGSVTC